MIGFFLKKNFCDGWDNMFSILISNLISIIFFALSLFLMSALSKLRAPFDFFAGSAAFIILFGFLMVLVVAYSESARLASNFSTAPIGKYFEQIPCVFKDAFFYGALLAFLLMAGHIGIPAYISRGDIFGILAAVLLCSFEVVLFLSLQWFIPLRILMKNDFKKCIKKCFIIFFDNTAFSVFMFAYILFLAILSCFLFIVPGPCGIVMALVNALRLRLYKYDWLEANPQYNDIKSRKNIPWAALLKEDQDALGPRPLKSFIFPWKM